MGKPKQHHFVPEWYLKQFTDEDAFLHIYDKQTGLWRRQKPGKVMRRNGYYKQDWAPAGIDTNILEHKFAQLEGNARKAIAKLLAWEEDLSNQEWANVLIYLQVQRIRVPRQAEQAKEILRSLVLIHGNPGATSKLLQGKWQLKIADSFRFDFMKIVGNIYIKMFMRMDWEIINANSASLVTTDSPVTLYNPSVVPPLEPGLGQAATLVMFPLNANQILIMSHPEAHDMEPAEQIPNPETERECRVSERTEKWPDDQVDVHNGIMIDLADRLVVANSKEVLERALGKAIFGHRKNGAH